jgi:hypothetical protein
MIPKEKAKELVDNMMPFVYIDKSIGQYFNGKQCALIVVNEILSLLWAVKTDVAYWSKVKKEIQKL